MNKAKVTFLLLFSLSFLSTSCAHRLAGTWTVETYERNTPGEEGMSVKNIGTITFDNNGTGQKNLDYSLLGISRKDKTPFEWSSTEEYITIDSENSEISKTWIYIEDKNKFQKWQSTDGSNSVQTLELRKQ